jgi:hypothetical protein
MKKSLVLFGFFIASVILFTQVNANNGNPEINGNASFKWNVTIFDFGKIQLNIPVEHRFSFTNNGNAPLIITSVQASCGCTVADYSTEPVQPGTAGFVKVKFNAASIGQFTKTVTINANTNEGVVLLTVKGEVVE